MITATEQATRPSIPGTHPLGVALFRRPLLFISSPLFISPPVKKYRAAHVDQKAAFQIEERLSRGNPW